MVISHNLSSVEYHCPSKIGVNALLEPSNDRILVQFIIHANKRWGSIPFDCHHFFVLRKSKGFPSRDPRAPVAQPDADFLMKAVFSGMVHPKAILHVSYIPRRIEVYDDSQIHLALTTFQRANNFCTKKYFDGSSHAQ